MKKTILLIVSVILVITCVMAETTHAEAPVEGYILAQNASVGAIKEYVGQTAHYYKLSPELADYIAENESNFNIKEIGDLHVSCPYGGVVYSRGLFQFSRCYYSNILDSQAFDPVYSTNIALQYISNGGKKFCINQWTTCKWYFKKYPHAKFYE
jgi:soluble lytic murein transglycosylase-like protein